MRVACRAGELTGSGASVNFVSFFARSPFEPRRGENVRIAILCRPFRLVGSLPVKLEVSIKLSWA